MRLASTSLRFKVLASLMIGLGVAFSGLIAHQSLAHLDLLEASAEEAGRDYVGLMAAQSRVGIATRDPDLLEGIDDHLDEAHDHTKVAMTVVIDREGERLKSFELFGSGVGISLDELTELARAAVRSDAEQRIEQDRFLALALPSRRESGREVFGAVAVVWDLQAMRAKILPYILQQAAIGTAGAGLAMLLLALAMQRAILRPLCELSDGVNHIRESGDLSAIPPCLLARGDEIAGVAKRFAELLDQLDAARLALIKRSEAEIGRRKEQLDTALETMSQGLAMFDAQERLVLSNRRFADLYRLPASLLEPGTPASLVLAASQGAGPSLPGREAEAKALAYLETLEDGRVIAVSREPMDRGGWVATFEDITERKVAEAQIAHMAHHDSLTGLPNRVRFRAELESRLSDPVEHKTFAVLCLDLDHFKAVNDTLGHPIGDLLLQAVAKRLTDCLGEAAIVARLGGDEFAVIQSGSCDLEALGSTAERLIDCLADPYMLDGHQVVAGTSIGIAIAPADAKNADELIKAADLALYRSKEDGRGTLRFFESAMDARMQERRAMEIDLRKALATGEFEVWYQPIVGLDTDTVRCFEALIRWRHPERGMVAPSVFIPLAEEIGLIGKIGAYVLRQACTDAARWAEDIRVAVNLSPAQFRTQSLVFEVDAALDASGLAPNRLELEITETVLLQQTDQTLSILNQLRAMGVRISMDDFGTGYSSLSYLRTFPFDKIKIDRSFITDLDAGGDAAAIVRAIAGLGTNLGISTTAEGVETREQLEKLRAEGCSEAQGFFFSPAVNAASVAGLLDQLAARRGAAA